MRVIKTFIISTIATLLTGCFTGVEGTKKITDEDVSKVSGTNNSATLSPVDTLHTQRFADWIPGKRFIVADEQIKLVFRQSDKGIDLTAGDTISYSRYDTQNLLGLQDCLVITLQGKKGQPLNYQTNKTLAEINAQSIFSIPFLIDCDMLDKANSYLAGSDYYIKTANWFDANGNLVSGTKFMKVNIRKVEPGNKVYPMKIVFSYDSKDWYVYISSLDNNVYGRIFSNIFSINDLRESYPGISDENWMMITQGKVVLGMTKEECRLSLGTPDNIDRIPTYDGLKEIWKYSDGVYLIFEDGLLTKYRK